MLGWAQSRNLNLIWNNLSSAIELGTNLIQSCILEKLSNSFIKSSEANIHPRGSRGHPGYTEWGWQRPTSIQCFLFFIALVPISEQHLAAWQPMPHILDQQHRALLDRFHGVFLQLFHLGCILTGCWEKAGVTGHRDQGNPRARVEGFSFSATIKCREDPFINSSMMQKYFPMKDHIHLLIYVLNKFVGITF